MSETGALFGRKAVRSGRNGESKNSLLVGRFSLLEAALRAKVVRWIIDFEMLFHGRLV